MTRSADESNPYRSEGQVGEGFQQHDSAEQHEQTAEQDIVAAPALNNAAETPAQDEVPEEVSDDSETVEEATEPEAESKDRRFARWRRGRPFFAGLWMILGGAIILMPAYLSLEISNIMIQVSTISGVSTMIIGVLLIVCGLMTWFGGGSRILTGVTALILGLIALPTSNLGGLVVGTLCALIGGALALSWVDESKEDARERRAEKKRQRKLRKGGMNSSTSAVIAAFAATGLATGVTLSVDSPNADAQIKLPPLPQLPGPGEAPAPQGGQAPNAPAMPELPPLPKPEDLPKIPAPQLPPPPNVQVPEDLQFDLNLSLIHI